MAHYAHAKRRAAARPVPERAAVSSRRAAPAGAAWAPGRRGTELASRLACGSPA